MSKLSEGKDRKEKLKEIIKQLHEGAKPEDLKRKFKEILENTDSTEIAVIEDELIKEGMPKEEIHRLCDVHLSIFKESLEKERVLAPPGHPINTLMEEHKLVLQFSDMLKNIGAELQKADDYPSVEDKMEHLNHIAEHFKDSEKHYLREENVLFPYLEKHGITGPPAIMWSEHNEIREMKKRLYEILDARNETGFSEFAKGINEIAQLLGEMLSNHFYKENNVLFPMSMKTIAEDEWRDIRQQFDEVGYCCFTPEYARMAPEKEEKPTHEIPATQEGRIPFESGTLSRDELELIFNNLPVDITFVDKDDSVRYFSQTKDRIFVRSKAIIGRKVQQCHPQKSLQAVQQILNDFRENKKDSAEFWINLNDRLIYIRYFPVRNNNGEYLGCLEVTQDITDIKKIEGEKRL